MKKTIVLVHGAWHGGWCYEKVSRILQAKGHDVFRPTLTGLADRSHLSRYPIGLATHIQDIVNLIEWERLNEVVLCGHSYGGMVITGVSDRLPGRISELIYLDALIPRSGQSVALILEEAAADDWSGLIDLIREAEAAGSQSLPPLPASLFGLERDNAEMVNRLCTPQPIATFLEPIELEGNQEMVARKVCVIASARTPANTPPPLHCFRKLSDRDRWEFVDLPCGHDVMIEQPDALAAILEGKPSPGLRA